MNRWVCLAICGLLLSSNTGCIVPIYSTDPVRRQQQLLVTSENLRQITNEWERIWFLDQPVHMDERVDGRIIGGNQFGRRIR